MAVTVAALSPLVRMAWRDARRDWQRSLLTSTSVFLPVAIGAYLGPVLIGLTPFHLILLVMFAMVIALSVGAVLAANTKRRVIRYGRLTAIGADPQQIKRLLFLEAVPPTIVAYLAGLFFGSTLSLLNGPFRWFFEDERPDGEQLAFFASFPSLVHLLLLLVALFLAIATGAGIWFAVGPAAKMALDGPVTESPVARAPEPEPRRYQGRIGVGVIVAALLFCVLAQEFYPNLLTLAVVVVFVGLHLVMAPAIASFERYANRFPASVRLAVRNGSRNRTRLGRLTLACLATVTLGVMASAGLESDKPENAASGRSWPMDQRFILTPLAPGQTETEDGPLIRETVTVTDEAILQYLEVNLQLVHHRTEDGYSTRGLNTALFTPELIMALDPDEETLAALDRGEIILASGVGLSVTGKDRDPTDPSQDFITHSVRLGFGDNQYIGGPPGDFEPLALISPQTAESLGALQRPDNRLRLFVAETPVDQRQRSILAGEIRRDALVSGTGDISDSLVQRLVLGLASVFLFVFGLLGTTLSGLETEHEVSTMIANGARPSIRRWFRSAQAALQMLLAGLVGAPLGVLLFWAVTRTDSSVPSAIYPWEAILILGLVVPIAVVVVVTAATASGTPTISRRAMA